MTLIGEVGFARGFDLVLGGHPQTPSESWAAIKYLKERDCETAVRDALTEFRLLLVKEQGGTAKDVISHLMSPSQRRRSEEAEQRKIDEDRLALFKSIASQYQGVEINARR